VQGCQVCVQCVQILQCSPILVVLSPRPVTYTGSRFNAIFGCVCCHLRYTTQCSKCSHEYGAVNVIYKVDLPVPRELSACSSAGNLISFQHCVDSFFEREILEKLTCPSCNKTTFSSSSRRLSFSLTGEIVVFSMQWFVNVGNNSEILRIRCSLTGYMTIEIPGQTSFTTGKYGLCGIVFHCGSSRNKGHFICVGRASRCVARKCTGMVNATQTCEHHGWRLWNDACVSESLCFNDAIQMATGNSTASIGADGYRILNCDSILPAMLFYTRLADDDGSDDSLGPRWALCNRGDTWREGI